MIYDRVVVVDRDREQVMKVLAAAGVEGVRVEWVNRVADSHG